MIVTLFLLSVSLVVALIFLAAYIWSIKSGQFDDDFGPAHRIFFDDNLKKQKSKTIK
jgi:cbb3-type cytochrome oxidase maturation protein